MNEFTKHELNLMFIALPVVEATNELKNKLQFMIDSYQEDSWNKKKIAESCLNEATSLISHAMCLLDMKEDV